MSTGQALGAVTGAVAGFVIGGPTGALYGAQIGMMAGGYLDPPKGPTQEGPRLSDTSVQTSTYGAFIARTYGTVAINGNIFWLENNKLKETVKKKKSGGKGGGSSVTTKTYSYSATLAISICEGPIAGIQRIWAGPDLVYDAGTTNILSIAASNKNRSRFAFYLGDDTQLPDSRMQADLGAANVSAYRGMAYVVIKDFQLAKYGNAIPQFKFEVVGSGTAAAVKVADYTLATPTYLSRYAGFPGIANGVQMSLIIRDAYTDPWHLSQMTTSGMMVKNDISYSGYVTPITRVIGANYGWVEGYSSAYIDGKSFPFPYDSSGLMQAVLYSGSVLYLLTPFAATYGLMRSDLDSPYPAKHVPWDRLHSICIGSGYLIGLKVTGSYPASASIVLYDLEDLSIVNSVSITPSSGLTEGEPYCISYDGDGVWLNPVGVGYLDTATQYDIFTGEILQSVYIPVTRYIASSHIEDGLLTAYEFDDNVVSYGAVTYALRQTVNVVPLSGIASAECLRTGLLSSSDFDVSGLTDSVTGYRISKIGGIRQAIEPLQGAFMFDVIQSGYKIKFISRGGSPIASAVIGDLGVDVQLKQTREMDSQMPVQIVANYLDKGRNYDSNTQTWERLGTDSVNTRSLDLPIVLTATQAAQIVERLGGLYWLERVDVGPFTLPPTFGSLEPSDVITLDAGYAVYDLRLTSVNYKSDGSIECMARPHNASVYISNATANDTNQIGSVPFYGASNYELLDVPPISSELQDGPGIIGIMAGYYPAWNGGVIYSSTDSSQTWADLQAYSSPCTYGHARGVLGAHAGRLINLGDTLTIDLVAGTLESVTQAQMLNGANICAYGVNGRMEVLRFTNATLNGDGSYTISGLWRGDFGSEWATGLHVSGDIFALLTDSDAAVITLEQSSIGQSRDYRGISNGDDIDSDFSRKFTYAGANLKPLSGCQAVGTRASGDLTITWKRRSRGNGWYDYADAPLLESTESYSIDVMNGTTVVRTLTALTPSVIYTSAQQTTDFGSPQSSVTLRIYQISSVVGRGNKLEVTL